MPVFIFLCPFGSWKGKGSIETGFLCFDCWFETSDRREERVPVLSAIASPVCLVG
jgi:hypothetical protein